MDIVRPEAMGAPELLKQAPEGPEAPGKGKGFGEVFSEMDGQQIRIHSPEEPKIGVEQQLKIQQLKEDKTRIAQEPGGIQKLGAEMQRGTTRMNEIIEQLKGGQTFSPQELLGMQSEMHDITMQIEVTTRVVGETVSAVQKLMQQQA